MVSYGSVLAGSVGLYTVLVAVKELVDTVPAGSTLLADTALAASLMVVAAAAVAAFVLTGLPPEILVLLLRKISWQFRFKS